MTVSLAETTPPFPDIYVPSESATTRFSGHHRHKDPTWFTIPTAGMIHFPDKNSKSDSEPNSIETENIHSVTESPKFGGGHWGLDSGYKQNILPSSKIPALDENIQSLNKEKGVFLNDTSSSDNRNSEDVDLSNTQVIVNQQSNY